MDIISGAASPRWRSLPSVVSSRPYEAAHADIVVFMPDQPSLFSDSSYTEFLNGLKARIRRAQVKAALAVNRELIYLYGQLGHEIKAKVELEGWGSKVIDRLAKDLKREFPDIKGFSRSNLKYMRVFAGAYPEGGIGQQLAGQIPWFHNCVLLDKVKGPQERLWYIQQTIENGWSRNVLVMQIESQLYERQGGAITNFERTLPSPQSDLAQQLIKDPYAFDLKTAAHTPQLAAIGISSPPTVRSAIQLGYEAATSESLRVSNPLPHGVLHQVPSRAVGSRGTVRLLEGSVQRNRRTLLV